MAISKIGEIWRYARWEPFKSGDLEYIVSKTDQSYAAFLLKGDVILVLKKGKSVYPRIKNRIDLVMFQAKYVDIYVKSIFQCFDVEINKRRGDTNTGCDYSFSLGIWEDSQFSIEEIKGQNLDFFIDPFTKEIVNLWELFPGRV